MSGALSGDAQALGLEVGRRLPEAPQRAHPGDVWRGDADRVGAGAG